MSEQCFRRAVVGGSLQQGFSAFLISTDFPEVGQFEKDVWAAVVGGPPPQGFSAFLISSDFPEVGQFEQCVCIASLGSTLLEVSGPLSLRQVRFRSSVGLV
ncbi:hypothetical protein F9278_15170 [Streptomyces phaeolivaceus]|uniref:Uncharacterized protein n=1 Tax=Streptomyces phaeolivaceus TaxID=2653200 RepID=A0A5P8K2R8_9ACTN|nr:hypothetical protein [Streptomyces phaeolivaceus]QFQ97326.1 hypothetical protein F9278_15170 [Streptomyces phaeolivaceus]